MVYIRRYREENEAVDAITWQRIGWEYVNRSAYLVVESRPET